MKNTQTSYADAAASIIRKFKTRVDQGDQMATDAMNKHLSKLRDEQEAVRQSMMQKEQKKQFKKGGYLPRMDEGGGWNPFSTDEYTIGGARSTNSANVPANPMIASPTNRKSKYLLHDNPIGPRDADPSPIDRINPIGLNIDNIYSSEQAAQIMNTNQPYNSQVSKSQVPQAGGLSNYQLGTLGSNLAGSLGQLIPMLAAQKVKMPTANAVGTPDYIPERGTEEMKAIERGYQNVMREDSGASPAEREAMKMKAYISQGQQLGQLGERLYNTNARGRGENDRLKTSVGLENERNRISTETLGAQKKLSDLSAMSGWVGNLGQTAANTFADAQKEQMQLVSLAAMSPAGYGMQKMGKDYYKSFRPDGNSGIVFLSGVTNGKQYAYKNGKSIPIDQAQKEIEAESTKNQVKQVKDTYNQKAYGGTVRPRYSIVDGQIIKG